MPGKELGDGDFSRIPNGMNGIEDRMLVLWTKGVGEGRISANQFVALTATNPAKVFGLYPQKGTIAVGSDADLVIWDAAAEKEVSWLRAHGRVDHNVFEGWRLRGLPHQVFVRGNLLVEDENWHGESGGGAFLRRSSHAPLL
jgi:dihydropyrimidinase